MFVIRQTLENVVKPESIISQVVLVLQLLLGNTSDITLKVLAILDKATGLS